MKPPVFSEAWPDEVKALYRHDMREIWDRSIAPHIWNQYHNQIDLYLKIAGSAPLDVLDVGCAQGTLALRLAEQGHRVTAIDLRSEFLEYARSRHTHGDVRFLQANVLTDEIAGSYDLVFANQLVEHLVYPRELLARLRNNLRAGGRLAVTTPNGNYLRGGLPSFHELGDPRKWEHLQFTADGDGHFFAYRAEELVEIFQSSGFMDVTVSFFESPFISGHMKVRYLHRRTPVVLLGALDRLLVGIPWIGRRLSHQLLAIGKRAS
jgi:2-polyprenyl-3-methyl-5-hydroxy-6-metoxy-1,4-benzoquinol methylase